MPDLQYESTQSVSTNTSYIVHDPAHAQIGFFRALKASTSAGQGGDFKPPRPSEEPPDHLAFARHDGGTSLFLRFSDGHTATVDLAKLGVKTSRLRLKTASAAAEGSAVEIQRGRGKMVHIDSAVLRSHCDPKYAAELRKAIADVTARDDRASAH